VNLIRSEFLYLLIRSILIVIFLFNGPSLGAKNVNLSQEYNRLYQLFSHGKFSLLENQLAELEESTGLNWDQATKDIKLLRLKYLKAEVLCWKEKIPESLKLSLSILDPLLEAREYSIAYRLYLNIALCHEKIADYDVTNQYLNMAYQLYKAQKLDTIYSHYCIRRSSYFYQTANISSALSYAQDAEVYATRYHNNLQLQDAYILLGFVHGKSKNYDSALVYSKRLENLYRINQDTSALAINFVNISSNYLKSGNLDLALVYCDSAYQYYHNLAPSDLYCLPKARAAYYEKAGQLDSALHFYQKFHNDHVKHIESQQKQEINEMLANYESVKNKATIKSQNQRITFIASLLIIIVFTSILLANKNRRIRAQNKIINRQLDDLIKALDQKQVLLSELQHRVKNNLQHVISILEIQKESVNFNNIDELIRSNQNRIHSMVLLHNKLNVSENVFEVDFPKYVIDIAELVKDSYDNSNQKITLKIKCEVPILSIDKALPIGMIIVELVSNSMKYAFTPDKLGVISISITSDSLSNQKRLYYVDNGPGFNFSETNYKGLGLEIIKGLIDQINGDLETNNTDGFFFVINFN
jgi:two-component sensor histidine kinase